jgi:hypothetical protein
MCHPVRALKVAEIIDSGVIVTVFWMRETST